MFFFYELCMLNAEIKNVFVLTNSAKYNLFLYSFK